MNNQTIEVCSGLIGGRVGARSTAGCEDLARQTARQVQEDQNRAFLAAKDRLEELRVHRIVGTGTFSVVRIAQEKSSGRPVALKVISKLKVADPKSAARAHREKSILAQLHHPFVVDFYGSFQDLHRLYLALEYVPGGELYSYLCKRGMLSKAEARFYAAEVASALAYLHSEGVVYRDLKSENILIAATGHIKLTDFGFAKRLKACERTYTLCGTPHFMAPEVVNRSGHDFECDWWALGILLCEMLIGSTPFEADSAYDMYANILTKALQLPKETDGVTSDLLSGLLEKDPARRYSADDVKQHQFFAGVEWNQIQSLLPPAIPVLKDSLDDHLFELYGEEPEPTETVVDQSKFAGY